MEELIKSLLGTDRGDLSDAERLAIELKAWRLRKGYTQTEVGNILGYSRYTIMRAEKGTPPLPVNTQYVISVRLSSEIRKEAGHE